MSDVVVYDNPELDRYEAYLDGTLAGFAQYRDSTAAIELFHTEVGDAFSGRGVAGELARFALDDIRAKGTKVLPTCEFMAGWIAGHPDYADLTV